MAGSRIGKLTANFYLFYYVVTKKNRVNKSEDVLKKLQDKKISKLMKEAYEIPFYRERFERVHLKPKDFKTVKDLVKFPILTKAEYRDFIQKEWERNPDKYKNWSKDGTSGTTGMPLTVYTSPKEHAILQGNWLRVLMNNGYRLFFDKVYCIVSPHRMPKRDSILQKFGIGKRVKVSQLDEVKYMVDTLNQEKPDVFYSNKSQMIQMIMYARKQKITLYQPKSYVCVAETMDAVSKKMILESFGAGYAESYGCTETGTMAFISPKSHGNFLMCKDTHAFLILNEEGEISDCGNVYVTSLYQKGFPLINYRIGDSIETEIIDGKQYITKVNGRSDDWLYCKDGSVLPFHYFYEAMESVSYISQFRVIQKKDKRVIMQLVLKPETLVTKEEAEEKILLNLNKIFVGKELSFSFEWLEKIPVDPNGKIRMLLSECEGKTK